MDFLAHEESPLNKEQWEALDNVVMDTIKHYLIGRKFIPIYGPLGAGMPAVMIPQLEPLKTDIIQAVNILTEFKELSQDFIMSWKSFEIASRLDIPMDWSLASVAAYHLALKEDTEIFNILLGSHGKITFKPGDWSIEGGLLGDVTKAIGKLIDAGHLGPYAVVLSPVTQSILYRFVGNSGVMEIKLLEELMKSGVFISNHIGNNQILIVETGTMNMDLALGMDVRTAYLGPTDMNYSFRILETVALRIKKPSAICLIG